MIIKKKDIKNYIRQLNNKKTTALDLAFKDFQQLLKHAKQNNMYALLHIVKPWICVSPCQLWINSFNTDLEIDHFVYDTANKHYMYTGKSTLAWSWYHHAIYKMLPIPELDAVLIKIKGDVLEAYMFLQTKREE